MTVNISAGCSWRPKGRASPHKRKVFYRVSPSHRLSHIGTSDKKKNAMVTSMKLHIQYLRSLEESERVRLACLTYLQNWYHHFYPERPDIAAELQSLAEQLHGALREPRCAGNMIGSGRCLAGRLQSGRRQRSHYSSSHASGNMIRRCIG